MIPKVMKHLGLILEWWIKWSGFSAQHSYVGFDQSENWLMKRFVYSFCKTLWKGSRVFLVCLLNVIEICIQCSISVFVICTQWMCNEWIWNEWMYNEWICNEWICNEWICNEWIWTEWMCNGEMKKAGGSPHLTTFERTPSFKFDQQLTSPQSWWSWGLGMIISW